MDDQINASKSLHSFAISIQNKKWGFGANVTQK